MTGKVFLGTSVGLALLAAQALAQGAERTGAESGGPLADQEVGKRFEIRAEDLPDPQPDEAVRNPALVIDRGDSRPELPRGFRAEVFASGIEMPRKLFVLPSGDVLVARQYAGEIMFLRDENGDGQADVVSLFAKGFDQPYGIAQIREGEDADHILVADVRGIWRIPYANGEIRATGAEIFSAKPLDEVPESERGPQKPMDHFPVTEQSVFGRPIGHTTRSLLRDPQTGTLYVGVGSAGNIAVEPEPRATIQAFDADGSNQRTYASGLRNPIGMAFHPQTDALWAVVQERDGLGNDVVPDYLTQIREGGFYGWPYAYAGGKPQPGFAERAPEKVEQTILPDVLFESHSAAMNLVFYDGSSFPEEYRGDAFVALKGSWNRADPTGYKVVRVPFENGEPQGGYENFMTGFWVRGEDRAVVWGRPTDLAVLPDGSMLVAVENSGEIWRVSYEGEEATGSTTPGQNMPDNRAR